MSVKARTLACAALACAAVCAVLYAGVQRPSAAEAEAGLVVELADDSVRSKLALAVTVDDDSVSDETETDSWETTPYAPAEVPWTLLPYAAGSPGHASGLVAAVVVSGPVPVDGVSGTIGFVLYAHVPAGFHLACVVPILPPLAARAGGKDSEVVVNASLAIQPWVLAAGTTDTHTVNVRCTLPAEVWADAQRLGWLEVGLRGSLEVAARRERLAGPYLPAPSDGRLCFCSSALFFPGSDSQVPPEPAVWRWWLQRVVEFVEHYRVLGVSHFVMYLTRLPAHNDTQAWRELAYYGNAGLVTWVDYRAALRMPRPNILAYHGQVIAQNECLLRQSRTCQFGLFLDLDEFIFFHDDGAPSANSAGVPDGALARLMRERHDSGGLGLPALQQLTFQSINFYGHICAPGLPVYSEILARDGQVIPELHWRMSHVSSWAPKYVCVLNRTAYVETHAAATLNPRAVRRSIIPPATAVIHHYRNGVLNAPSRCTDSVNGTETALFGRYKDPTVSTDTKLIYSTTFETMYKERMLPRIRRVWKAMYKRTREPEA